MEVSVGTESDNIKGVAIFEINGFGIDISNGFRIDINKFGFKILIVLINKSNFVLTCIITGWE